MFFVFLMEIEARIVFWLFRVFYDVHVSAKCGL